ncbi:MAG: NAD(P)-binding protein, partial [Candidatus Nealsonbacteria bacterium]|nr:NAD(P)-binding protein [Candidatus Nealsonbacteria bacterium]
MSGATPPYDGRQPNVAIIGGGLAGSAAAVRAAEAGWRVELFEQKRVLGGRAASFRDPKTRQLVDCCQHVAMGCCTNLADFCRRIGAADGFRRDGRLHFFGPDGRRCDFAAAGWLPTPLHLLPGLMRLKYLTRGQLWSIGRTLLRLARGSVGWGEARDPRGNGRRQRITRGSRT